MGMQTYESLVDRLEAELDEIDRHGGLTDASLCDLDKVAHAIKSLYTVMAMKKADGEVSEHDYFKRGMREYRSRDDMDGRSRDRYYDERMPRGYSRDGEREQMLKELRELMAEAPDEETRKKFRRFINELDELH